MNMAEYFEHYSSCGKKLEEIYINRGKCRSCYLCKGEGGKILLYWEWMEAHGNGETDYSKEVHSVEEVREGLQSDVDRQNMTPAQLERACKLAEKYFKP